MDGEMEWMVELAGRLSNPITFLVMDPNACPRQLDALVPGYSYEVKRGTACNLRPQVASRASVCSSVTSRG